MTIRRGQAWEEPGSLGPTDPVFSSDASLALYLESLLGNELDNFASLDPSDRGHSPVVALTGGDLARTLGVVGRDPSKASNLVAVDALLVRCDDDRSMIAMAHVVHGMWLPFSRCDVAANAAFIDTANVAPKAHPGDSFIDHLRFDLDWRQTAMCRRRMRTGTHVPHPNIGTKRTKVLELRSDRRRPVTIDSVKRTKANFVEIRVISHAVRVAV